MLVVDDEPLLLRMVAQRLRMAGLFVVEASDVIGALEIIDEDEPDVVLLDVMMPVTSGYELCEALRARYDPSELPVILLTARARSEDLLRGFRAGANDYITKPFSGEELLARVKAQLAVREARDRLEETLLLRAEVKRRRVTEALARRSAKAAKRARLRLELRPHLLFNALASIRAAVSIDPSAAKRMTGELARYYRRVLELGELHPLHEEIALTRLYLCIETSLGGVAVEAEIHVDPRLHDLEVPTLILQPLVENALKHGAPASSGGCASGSRPRRPRRRRGSSRSASPTAALGARRGEARGGAWGWRTSSSGSRSTAPPAAGSSTAAPKIA